MDKELTQISKFLSFVLRHKPDAIGLTLDAEGWADIDEIIAKADIPITAKQVAAAVATNDKKRFALSKDGRAIRANQGHSIKVDLGLQATEPLAQLYHGTAERFLDSILTEGLKPQNRQFVHLSRDTATATTVGARHGKPVVLIVPAFAMHERGHRFYLAANGVWLTDSVPADAISTLDH